MRVAAKKALANMQSIEMFSKDGWKRVNKACGHIVPDLNATHPDIENGSGILDYMIIWWDDNGVEEADFSQKQVEQIHEDLIQRFVEYLQGD